MLVDIGIMWGWKWQQNNGKYQNRVFMFYVLIFGEILI